MVWIMERRLFRNIECGANKVLKLAALINCLPCQHVCLHVP